VYKLNIKKKQFDQSDYDRFIITNLLACAYRNEDPVMTKKFQLFMAKQNSEAGGGEGKKGDLCFHERQAVDVLIK